MKARKYSATIDLSEVEVEVEYTYHKAYRGAREGGLQLEPDEEAGVEIENVSLVEYGPDGMERKRIDVTEYADTDALQQEIEESLVDDGPDCDDRGD